MRPLPVCTGPRAGPLCRLCAAQPTPLHRARPHPDRHLASDAAAAAIHAVALSGLAASQTWRGRSCPMQRQLRERAWAAANVRLTTVTLDTDTTVHTLYGQQMGGRKSYNPKNKGKRSYQPILTFLAETREYLMGGLHNGDRPTGKKRSRRTSKVLSRLCRQCEADLGAGRFRLLLLGSGGSLRTSALSVRHRGRARPGDWSSSCSKRNGSPRPTATLRRSANSSTSRKAGAGPAALSRCRYEKEPETDEVEQYQLFATSAYTYRVVRHQPHRADRGGGVVLQPAGWGGEPHQRSQQRRRAGGPSFAPL